MPPSTLNYWVQIKLVRPSFRGPEGHRVEQWWSVEDVVIVRTIRALRQQGSSLQQVRKVRSTLESWGHSLSDTRLIWTGGDIVAHGPNGELSSALSEPGQQMFVLDGLPIDVWYREALAHAVPVDLPEFRRTSRRRRRVQAQRREPIANLLGRAL